MGEENTTQLVVNVLKLIEAGKLTFIHALPHCVFLKCLLCVLVSSPIHSGDKTDPGPDLGAACLMGRFSWHEQKQDWNSGEWSL